nr:MAG TPA: hypothetical protein [Caudoviricetes sp.]
MDTRIGNSKFYAISRVYRTASGRFFFAPLNSYKNYLFG